MSFFARKDNSKIFNFSLKKVLNSLGRKFWIIWNIWNEFRQSRDNSGNVVAGKKRILVKKSIFQVFWIVHYCCGKFLFIKLGETTKFFFQTCVMLVRLDKLDVFGGLRKAKIFSKEVHTFIRCQTSGLSNLAQTWHSLQKKRISSS